MLLYHEFLVEADSFEDASSRVEKFLDTYELVNYQKINIIRARSCKGSENPFTERLEIALKENNGILKSFIKEFQTAGITNFDHLHEIKQGYLSKLFHITAHFLDGFFDIDSCFYNLSEHSHQVSGDLFKRITDNPADFWLVAVDAETASEIHGFEKKKSAD